MADLIAITRENGIRRAINLDNVLAVGRTLPDETHPDGIFYIEYTLYDPKAEEPVTDYYDLPGDEERLEPLFHYLEYRWRIDMREAPHDK